MARRSQRHARIAVTLFPRRELTHAASERGGAGCRARSVTSGRPQPVSTKYRADQFPYHCLLLFKGGDQLSSSIFEYVPHPYVAERRYSGSSTSDDPLGPIQRANAAAARFVTTGVGTMWCASLFVVCIPLRDFRGIGFPGLSSRFGQQIHTMGLDSFRPACLVVGNSGGAKRTSRSIRGTCTSDLSGCRGRSSRGLANSGAPNCPRRSTRAPPRPHRARRARISRRADSQRISAT